MTKKNIIVCITVFCTVIASMAETAVQKYGQLKIEGTKLLDKNGKLVQLRGMSLYWSQAYVGSGFYNANAVKWLVDDWKITVIRAAMGVSNDFSAQEKAYLNDPENNKNRVKAVVDAAIANGIYVIIDWHDHEANLHTSQAKAFFEDMARTYGSNPNVIYEIFNEPLDVSWASVVKPYADTVIAAIRKIDPDNIIIVGTPTWCQGVRAAARNPVTQPKNVAYALHFYAGSHTAELRSWAREAITLGGPLFVSEWGTCLASGQGAVDSASTRLWLKFIDSTGLSWCNWSICTKSETASALKSGSSTSGNWNASNFSPSGTFVRSRLLEYASGINSPVVYSHKQDLSSNYIQRSANRITILNSGEADINAFELLGVDGRIVAHSNAGENGYWFSTEGLGAGMYILRASGNKALNFPLIINK